MIEPADTHKFSVVKARKWWVEDLKALCPTRYPVKVVWSSPNAKGMEDCVGSCDLIQGKDPYFLVRVTRTLPRWAQCELLVHEWAHAMSWWRVRNGMDHGKPWGIAYSKAYQAAMHL